MTAKPLPKTLKTLAALISSALSRNGVEAVLTGGSCVTIYSHNCYQSMDLDFVTAAVETIPETVRQTMEGLGFYRRLGGYFEHPRCSYFVDFIPPPLAIGRSPVREVKRIRTSRGILRLLTPTDCVKDRLAAYYHWNDPQSFDQALLVARRQSIDWPDVERWSKGEGHLTKYRLFREGMRPLSKRHRR